MFIYPKNKPQFLYDIDSKVLKQLQSFMISDSVTCGLQVLFWTVVDTGPEYQIESNRVADLDQEKEEYIERF